MKICVAEQFQVQIMVPKDAVRLGQPSFRKSGSILDCYFPRLPDYSKSRGKTVTHTSCTAAEPNMRHTTVTVILTACKRYLRLQIDH